MNNLILLATMGFLMVVGVPGGASSETTQSGNGAAVRLQKVVLQPEMTIHPPVIDEDPKHAVVAAALDGQFSQASWILDEPIAKNNSITQIYERETADVGQRVVIQSVDKLQKGNRLTVHRPGNRLRDPEGGQVLGQMSATLGVVEVVSTDEKDVTAVVVKAFKEIMVGDLVDSFLNEKTPIQFRVDPGFSPSGPVVHVENDLSGAGRGQVVVVGLGMKDRVYPGLILPVFRVSRSKSLHESDDSLPPDPQSTGEVVLFRIAANASLALVIQAKEMVEIGDRVGVLASPPGCHENP